MSTLKRSGGSEGSSGSCIKKLKQEIDDITECAICKETLSNARMLSCCHLFCLECLKKFCENKVEGDDISCPVCRRNLQIPSGGVDKFPVCHFINKLIDVNKLTDKNSDKNKDGCCNPCLAIGRRETAVGYCFECREDLCEPCVQRHKVMNLSKSHKIVDPDSKLEAKELLKSAVSFCQEHPDQRIHFYCNDCKTVACTACTVVNHKEHDCSNIKEKSQSISEILDNHCELVRKYVSETTAVLKKAESTREDLMGDVNYYEAQISARYDMLKSLIDAQYELSKRELSIRKNERLGHLDDITEDAESEIACLTSFEKYWCELKECGSACDVVQAATSLQETVENLISQHEEKHKEREDKVEPGYYYIYTSSPMKLNKKSKLFGKVQHVNNSQSDRDNSSESDDGSESEENEYSDRDSRARSYVSHQEEEEEEQDEHETSQYDQDDEPEEAGHESAQDQGSSSEDESTPSPPVTTRSRSRVQSSSSSITPPREYHPLEGTEGPQPLTGPSTPAQPGADSAAPATTSAASQPVASRSSAASSSTRSITKSKHR